VTVTTSSSRRTRTRSSAASPRRWTRPELATDERYATHTARGAHQAELDELIAGWTAALSTDKLIELLEAHGVPNGLIYRAPEMLADPHFAAREAIVNVTHPLFGEFPMQNVVPKLSDTPGTIRWVGPELGEHNAEVYGEVLGRTPEEIAALAERAVI
jgi:formyl-CoA transferase